MASPSIHFLFPDGALGYDCASCDQRCCSGSTVFHAQRDRHVLAEHPELRPFVRPSATPSLRVLDMPRPRCFFLESTGHCQLQTKHGYRAKPATCRLYPANLIWQVPGRHEHIVSVYLRVCPLRLVNSTSAHTALAHGELRNAIEDFLGTGELHPSAAPTHLGSYPDWFLKVEDRILRELGHDRAASYDEYLAFQLAITNADMPHLKRPSARDLDRARQSIRAHVAETADLLGIDPSLAVDQRTSDALTACTGMFRMAFFFDAHHEDYRELLTRIPYALASIRLFAASQLAAIESIGARKASLDLQGVDALFHAMRALAMLTTYVEEAAVPRTRIGRAEWPAELRRATAWLANLDDDGRLMELQSLRERIRGLQVGPDDVIGVLKTFAGIRDAVHFAPLAE